MAAATQTFQKAPLRLNLYHPAHSKEGRKRLLEAIQAQIAHIDGPAPPLLRCTTCSASSSDHPSTHASTIRSSFATLQDWFVMFHRPSKHIHARARIRTSFTLLQDLFGMFRRPSKHTRMHASAPSLLRCRTRSVASSGATQSPAATCSSMRSHAMASSSSSTTTRWSSAWSSCTTSCTCHTDGLPRAMLHTRMRHTHSL